MRTILFSLLLASVAATPAMAARPGDGDGRRPHFERSESKEAPRFEAPRQDRSERPSFDRGNRGEQPQYQAREQVAPRAMTGGPGWQRRGPDDSALRAGRDPRPQFDRGGVQENVDHVQQRFQQREQAIRETSGGQYANRQWGGVDPRRYGGGSRPQYYGGTQPQYRSEGGRTSPVQWNRNWRANNRYDWQDQRRRHGSWFHVGAYYDPFGWGYQRFQIGWRLYPDYYSSRFWINDPGMFSLPFPPPGTQWIRYYDDALLVDMFSGQVIDVIPNFFW